MTAEPIYSYIDDVESCLQMEIIELKSDKSPKTSSHYDHNLIQFYSILCD